MNEQPEQKRPLVGVIIAVEVIGIFALIGLLMYQKYMAPKGGVAHKSVLIAASTAKPVSADDLFEQPKYTEAAEAVRKAESEQVTETAVVFEQPATVAEEAAEPVEQPAPVEVASEPAAQVVPASEPAAQVASKTEVAKATTDAVEPKAGPAAPDAQDSNELGDWQVYTEAAKANSNSAASGPPLPKVIRNPKIIVTKSKQILEVYDGNKLLRTYLASTGTNPGDKEKSGDRKTPEGEFYVCVKNPKSRFVLSLGLSYPSYEDAKRGLRAGLINQTEYNHIISELNMKRQPPWNTKLGGEVMIHGVRQGGRATAGCIALENDDIRELYPRINVGTKVIVKP